MLQHLRNAILAATATLLLTCVASPRTACLARQFSANPTAVVLATATSAITQFIQTLHSVDTNGWIA